MYKQLHQHLAAYGFIAVVLVGFSALFLRAWPDREMQRLLIACLMFLYFGWGIVTHTKTKQLTLHVVLEYLSVSLLAGVLLGLVTI
ncbi:MAG: hypothetical protein COU65_03935 [Candidatus Pacebacteria bacterium CG10_big_fil_rev_8_21_14_0_10_42_12]|nr:hypothetical protein [Candidatus Paceibacterota bacterium]PIR62322.1 MAG: hypothetical protein COU65_03935 [Candidatus Pacebacteria bacterium CG10_big_fil_rev_8_21_14_0_10_42_12]